MRFDLLQILSTQAALFGLGLLWLNFTKTVFQTAGKIIQASFSENASPQEMPDAEFE